MKDKHRSIKQILKLNWKIVLHCIFTEL